jgi:beta-glucosidase
VAERPYAEGVGDSSTLSLPSDDVALVAKVRPLVQKLVVVVMSGRPMVLGDLASADQIVAAWLPGTEATGLADVLLGDKPFSGRLRTPGRRPLRTRPGSARPPATAPSTRWATASTRRANSWVPLPARCGASGVTRPSR